MIHLENVYEQTPEMILALIETISSDNIGFCLDVGHMNAFSDTPLIDWLETLGPYLKEVHLHDNDGQGDVHGPIGSGKVPFEQLFQYLTNEGSRPLITFNSSSRSMGLGMKPSGGARCFRVLMNFWKSSGLPA